MTSAQQRAELQAQIWKIANDVRGSVDGWDFKQFVLGTLFYRFISENFSSYFESGDGSVNYAKLSDSVITPELKDDASALFKKETNNNILTDDHIDQIMKVFDSKADVDHFAKSVQYDAIAANDYNLSVSSYVEAEDTCEIVNITELNEEIKTTVAKIDKLRSDIDAIVAEIEA